jgi:hypothetical protein
MKIIHDRLQGIGIARTETLISFTEGLHRQVPILSDLDENDEKEFNLDEINDNY